MFGKGAQAQLECTHDPFSEIACELEKIFCRYVPLQQQKSYFVSPVIDVHDGAVLPVMSDPIEQARLEAYYASELQLLYRHGLYYGRYSPVRPWNYVNRRPKPEPTLFCGPIVKGRITHNRAWFRQHLGSVLDGTAVFEPLSYVLT